MPFSLVGQKLQAVLVWFKKSTPNAPNALADQGEQLGHSQSSSMYVDDTDGLVWFLQSDDSTGPVSKVIGTMLLALKHLRSKACQWNMEASALRLLIQAQIKSNTEMK
jgi:hypothetical protein